MVQQERRGRGPSCLEGRADPNIVDATRGERREADADAAFRRIESVFQRGVSLEVALWLTVRAGRGERDEDLAELDAGPQRHLIPGRGGGRPPPADPARGVHVTRLRT